VEALHLLGVAVLFGGVLLLSLSIVWVSRRIRIESVIRTPFYRLLGAAGLIAVLTGLLLFLSAPAKYLSNPLFILKLLGLLLAAGIQIGLGLRLRSRPPDGQAPRALAVACLVAWLLVLILGRWVGLL
jgi:hypothetical protein